MRGDLDRRLEALAEASALAEGRLPDEAVETNVAEPPLADVPN